MPRRKIRKEVNDRRKTSIALSEGLENKVRAKAAGLGLTLADTIEDALWLWLGESVNTGLHCPRCGRGGGHPVAAEIESLVERVPPERAPLLDGIRAQLLLMLT